MCSYNNEKYFLRCINKNVFSCSYMAPKCVLYLILCPKLCSHVITDITDHNLQIVCVCVHNGMFHSPQLCLPSHSADVTVTVTGISRIDSCFRMRFLLILDQSSSTRSGSIIFSEDSVMFYTILLLGEPSPFGAVRVIVIQLVAVAPVVVILSLQGQSLYWG